MNGNKTPFSWKYFDDLKRVQRCLNLPKAEGGSWNFPDFLHEAKELQEMKVERTHFSEEEPGWLKMAPRGPVLSQTKAYRKLDFQIFLNFLMNSKKQENCYNLLKERKNKENRFLGVAKSTLKEIGPKRSSIFFFYQGFLSRTLTTHRRAGEVFVCLRDDLILAFFVTAIWDGKLVDSNSHRLSPLYYKRTD